MKAHRLLALVLILLPVAAGACPYCAARPESGQRHTLYFIAAMCLLPLVVGGVAMAVIRRLENPQDSNPERRS